MRLKKRAPALGFRPKFAGCASVAGADTGMQVTRRALAPDIPSAILLPQASQSLLAAQRPSCSMSKSFFCSIDTLPFPSLSSSSKRRSQGCRRRSPALCCSPPPPSSPAVFCVRCWCCSCWSPVTIRARRWRFRLLPL